MKILNCVRGSMVKTLDLEIHLAEVKSTSDGTPRHHTEKVKTRITEFTFQHGDNTCCQSSTKRLPNYPNQVG